MDHGGCVYEIWTNLVERWDLGRVNKVHVLSEWLFGEEEEEEDGLELQSYQNDVHALTPVIS